MKIAIIGAGITGLTAAYKLSKKGHKVIVFERSQTPGGLGTYIRIESNYIERFYHHFFESDRLIARLAKELGIEKKLKFYKAKTGVYSDGKIYSFSSPMHVLSFKPLSLFNRVKFGIVFGFLKFLPFPLSILDTISAKKWILKFAGSNIYQKIWGPLLEGKFSKYSSAIPALWLWGRIRDRSPKLGYFDGSVKTLFDKLIKEIKKRKNVIKLGSEIIAIKSDKDGVLIKEKNAQYQFDKAIITTVSPIANLLIENDLPKTIRKQLSSIDHLGAVCLILELNRSVQSQYWLNICDKNAPVLVMIEHTNMIPAQFYGGRFVVYLANYIHRNDPRFRKTDEEILREYTVILRRVNPDFAKSWILKWYISRVPRAQTIFETGALKKIPPIEFSIPNIYMVNIDQMYPHDRNLDQGAELGNKVANIILEKLAQSIT